MKSASLFLLMALLLLSCGRQQQLKGKVFERKELKGNRLLIKYHYNFQGQDYTDSATMPNVVIRYDSIFLIIDPSNPGKSIPDIPY